MYHPSPNRQTNLSKTHIASMAIVVWTVSAMESSKSTLDNKLTSAGSTALRYVLKLR